MSSRTPIQVPEELKEKVDGLKNIFQSKTHYEVIEKLVTYYEKNECAREEARQAKILEEKLQKETLISAGQALKNDFLEVGQELFLKRESDILSFLIDHYKRSNSFDKDTLVYLMKLRG